VGDREVHRDADERIAELMLSERLFERRGEEIANTGSFLSPSVSLIEALGGGQTTSGTRVSPATAEGIPAWFATRAVVSETAGQVPLKVMRKLKKGGKQPDESHPLYYVLHDQFNPEMIAYEGKELLTRFVADWGNGYAEIVRNRADQVTALWPLASDRMTVDRDELNRKRYRYSAASGARFEWIHDVLRPPIFHLRTNTLNGLTGRSAIQILADCFGLTKAAEEFGARFFGNNAMPGMVATYKGKLTRDQKQNLRESWQKVNGGLSNAHRLAILENDIQITKMGVDPNAGQFLETRMLQIEEIARILRVPLFMIQHMTKSTSWGTGIEQMMRGFVNVTMMPWFTIWQQAIGQYLLTRKSFETHTAVFVVEGLIRANFAERQAGNAVKFDRGILTRNEWRAQDDYPAQEDEYADEPMVPINNMVPASLARERFQAQASAKPAAAAPATDSGQENQL
jgi:HK97 family phage portal protein